MKPGKKNACLLLDVAQEVEGTKKLAVSARHERKVARKG